MLVLEKWFTEDLSLEEARIRALNETTSKLKQRGLAGVKRKIEKWGIIRLSSQLRSHCQFLFMNLLLLIDLREKLEGQILSDLDSHPKLKQGVDLLEYLPGCRIFSRILLMSEIGEISRFKDVNAFLAYVGIGPSGKTSGIADFDEQTEKIVVRDHPNPQCNRRIKLILLTAARTAMKEKIDSPIQNDIER